MAYDSRPTAVLTLAVATSLAIDAANVRAYSTAWSTLAGSTVAGLVLAALAALWAWPLERFELPRAAERWLGALAVTAGALAIHLRGILGPGPLFHLGVVAALGVVVAIVGVALDRALLVALGAIACGLALRVFEMAVVPIDPSRGDMLPLVILAVRRVFAGENPYIVYQFPWPVPLTYLPGTWLAFAPLLAIGRDPRWVNVAAGLAILGAIAFAGRRARGTSPRAAIALWSLWFVSHRVIREDAGIAAPVQWAAIAWMTALAEEASAATPLVAGLACGTTVLAWPLLPLLAIGWRRAHSTLSSMRAAAIVVVIAAIVVAPWAAMAPQGFFDGTVRWFNDLEGFPRAQWNENRAWAAHPGLAGVFWTLDLVRGMKPIQAAVIVAIAVRVARREEARLAPAITATLLGFLAFNPITWGYLWEPAIATALVALAARDVR